MGHQVRSLGWVDLDLTQLLSNSAQFPSDQAEEPVRKRNNQNQSQPQPTIQADAPPSLPVDNPFPDRSLRLK